VAGHQWTVFLTPRSPETVDAFPIGENGAEWLSGATARPMAPPRAGFEPSAWKPPGGAGASPAPEWPEPPALTGPLEELAVLRRGWGGRFWVLAKTVARRLRR
jgi:hypothetical protein